MKKFAARRGAGAFSRKRRKRDCGRFRLSSPPALARATIGKRPRFVPLPASPLEKAPGSRQDRAGGYYHNGEFSGSGGMPARERWSQTGFCGIVRRKPHNSLRHASRSNTEESVGFNSQYTSANCENSVAVSTLGMLRQARGLGNRYENRLSNMRQ